MLHQLHDLKISFRKEKKYLRSYKLAEMNQEKQ